MSVKPASGEVAAGNQALCCLTFAPRSEKHRLNSLPVSCRISSGKQYNMLLTGASSANPFGISPAWLSAAQMQLQKTLLTSCPPCQRGLKGYSICARFSRHGRALAGTCHKPRLRLGFESYDFGVCFVRSSAAPALQCSLPLHNSDSFPIDIENRSVV